jgi:hypothetical protein
VRIDELENSIGELMAQVRATMLNFLRHAVKAACSHARRHALSHACPRLLRVPRRRGLMRSPWRTAWLLHSPSRPHRRSTDELPLWSRGPSNLFFQPLHSRDLGSQSSFVHAGCVWRVRACHSC